MLRLLEPVKDLNIRGLRMRTHGDLHLGQILLTGPDVVFIDFEGNAAGPRTARTTVPLRNLKDEVLVQFLPGGEPVIVGQLFAGVPQFELLETYDFWYDLDDPQKLDNDLVDAVFVLRRR